MNRKKLLVLSIFLIMLIAPFVAAFISHRPNDFFGGFLLNPIDGNSYLAKIQQGFNGEWKFQLPYSAQSNGNIFLFTFYILLGHIARILNISPLWIFHLSRIGMAVGLFFALDKFLSIYQTIDQKVRWIIFCTLLFGGGLGWIYVFFGDLPADFWVAEAFPFLSSFSNPHFTLSIALMLSGYYLAHREIINRWQVLYIALIGFVLSNISPFAVALVLLFFASQIVFHWRLYRCKAITSFLVFALSSLPVILYQYLSILSDSVLNGWNQQNITPAPNVLNFVFSFSPFLVGIAILLFLSRRYSKTTFDDQELGLIVWIVVVIILLYLPLNLQRRFLIAFYIPVVTLFFILLSRFYKLSAKNRKDVNLKRIWLFFYLALPSVAFIFLGSFYAIQSHNKDLYIPVYLIHASGWLEDNAKDYSVILSSTEMGLYLPAYSNVKSVSGHPFETINSEKTRLEVEEFWKGKFNALEKNQLGIWNVNYLFYGPEERKLGKPAILDNLPVVYSDNLVEIYEVAYEDK